MNIIIYRGGENIYPKEIEEYLLNHPGVEDCQVIGVVNEKYGEEVCAVVKVKTSYGKIVEKEEIVNFCKKKIAHYKIPKFVKFVENYPMTVTGKIQKYKIRELIETELKDPNLFESYKAK